MPCSCRDTQETLPGGTNQTISGTDDRIEQTSKKHGLAHVYDAECSPSRPGAVRLAVALARSTPVAPGIRDAPAWRQGAPARWQHDGVRVIPGDCLDPGTAKTPGMDLKAVNVARLGAQKLRAGTASIHPDAKTGAHHHGPRESVIFVVKGCARMRWGERLEFTAEAGPGGVIDVPPYVPHQEINASRDEVLECVLVRSDGDAVAINLDIEPVEKPETVLRVDPIHRDERA